MSKLKINHNAATEPLSFEVSLRDLKSSKEYEFDIVLDQAGIAALAPLMGVVALRKFRFRGTLAPVGKADWRLTADLGATAIQSCVITGVPVTTRIDEKITRRYVKNFAQETSADEIEFDGDDEREPLESVIDLGFVMTEAFGLSLPDYPKSEGAVLGEATFTAQGITPLGDDDAKPFASLAALRDKLEQ